MSLEQHLPCHVVVFVSQRTSGEGGYGAVAKRMAELASQQPGFMGMHSARDAEGKGITVVFFDSEESAVQWGRHSEHREAQSKGRDEWYDSYEIYHARAERGYSWQREPSANE